MKTLNRYCLSEVRILVDSREKSPLPFRSGGSISEVKKTGLKYGDYQAETEWGENMGICFERKSINDLWITLTKKTNHERFKREIERARNDESHMILIIEGTYSDVLRGNPRSSFKGISMIRMLFTIWTRYGLWPVFCNGRVEMKKVIRSAFEARGKQMADNRKKSK